MDVKLGHSEYRRPGLLENYYIARSRLGFDSCVVVCAKYGRVPNGKLSKENIFPALAQVVRKFAALSACVTGAGTETVSLSRLSTLDFNTLVEFADASIEDDKLHTFLEERFKTPLQPIPGQPLWKLTVTSNNFVMFSWSHIIGDGLSGLAFHRAFLGALNDSSVVTRPKVAVEIPDDIDLHPSLEELTDVSVSIPTFLRALSSVLIPRSWMESKIWTGNDVVREVKLVSKVHVRTIHLSPESTSRLLALSREHGASLTATLYFACIGTLSALIESGQADRASTKQKGQQFTGISTSIPVSLRRTADASLDIFGNLISSFQLKEPLRPLTVGNKSNFPWEVATAFTKKLHQGVPKTRETIGTLKYLFGNYERFFLSKLGKKRQVGLEVSNLGSFVIERGECDDRKDDSWSIGTTYFVQDDRVTGGALKASVVGGPDGSLGIAMSWGKDAVDDDFAGVFVRELQIFLHNLEG